MSEKIIRKEWKHIISHPQFYRIRNELETFLNADSHQVSTGYLVRSLYFDTLGKKDLHANLDGALHKCKLRLRTYPDNGQIFKLELKCKVGFDSSKRALILTEDEAKRITRSDSGFLLQKEEPLAAEIYQRLHLEGYRPELVVEYAREAYEHPFNRTRITYDHQVRATRIKEDFFAGHLVGSPILPPGKGILEVKYDKEFPGHLERILEKVGIRPEAFSKYSQGQLKTIW